MQTEQIVALLIAERDRLTKAIDALQDSRPRRGRRPGTAAQHSAQPAAAPKAAAAAAPARTKRVLSAAGRRAIAEAARKRWAAIRAAKTGSAAGKASKKK